MKLHCPMCGAKINHPLDLNEIGTFVAAPFAVSCSCGVELVIEFFFVNGQGRVGILVHKECSLKQSNDGAAAPGYSFKAEDVGEMKYYPLGNPDDPPFVPGWYQITSVEPAKEKTWRDRAIENPMFDRELDDLG